MAKIMIYDEYTDLGENAEDRAKDFFPDAQVIRFEDKSATYPESRANFLRQVGAEIPNVVILTGISPLNEMDLAKQMRKNNYRGGIVLCSSNVDSPLVKKAFEKIPLGQKNTLLESPTPREVYRKALLRYFQ